MLGLFKNKKQATKPKILVVDDEPDLLSTVEYRLKFADCDVELGRLEQEFDRARREHLKRPLLIGA